MHAKISISGSRRGILLVSGAAVLWGTVGIATQAIYRLSELNAVSVGFYRLAFAFPCVAFLCWKMVGTTMFSVDRRHTLQMVLIGIMLALYQVCYFAAISYIGVAVATLITLCSAPVIVALASGVFLKEAITRPIVIALACALLGTVVLIGFPAVPIVAGDLFAGVALSLGSALGYAIVALLGRSLAGSCHPVHSTTVSFGVGAIFLFPFAAGNLFAVSYSAVSWSLLLYVGLIPTAAAYTLFFWGMRHVKASAASILTMLEPLTATLLAWVLFGEHLSMAGLSGAGLLFIAIMVLYRGGRD